MVVVVPDILALLLLPPPVLLLLLPLRSTHCTYFLETRALHGGETT
jgi:hypothetical protein